MDLRPLRRRDFRLLYAAQSVSFLGTMVTYVALPWQMYALTGSSLAVGVLGVVELVPLLLTAFVGGALADWMDRRRLVIVTEIGLMAGCLALMANAARPEPSVAVLYVAAGADVGLQRPAASVARRDDAAAGAARRDPGRRGADARSAAASA